MPVHRRFNRFRQHWKGFDMKFLARQPILDRKRDVFAYELLFRDGIQNSCPGVNPELASTSVLDTSFLIGLEKIAEGHRMFVNCPRGFLLQGYFSLFPRDSIVIEILETIKPDMEVIAACANLKRDGFMLALDDFIDTPEWEPLVELTDFIKVDFRLTDREERQSIVERYAGRGIRLLAEKVESQDEFTEALKLGYALFQGYFFCRPEIMQHHSVPASKLAYLELLQEATGSWIRHRGTGDQNQARGFDYVSITALPELARLRAPFRGAFHSPRAFAPRRIGVEKVDRGRSRGRHGGREAGRIADHSPSARTVLRTPGASRRNSQPFERSVSPGTALRDGCDPRPAACRDSRRPARA
jgi:hypothetical protein